MTEEDRIQYFKEYRDKLSEVIKHSENEFEKKIIYISAGGLAVSMVLVKDVIPIGVCIYKWMLVCGWTGLILAIILNVSSQFVTKGIARALCGKIGMYLEGKLSSLNLTNEAKRMNVWIELFNYATISSMLFGIILILTFTYLNL